MKTAQELAAEPFTSPEEQKRQAVALRRVAGGVRAAAQRKEATGLTEKEVRALLDVAGILEKLASAHKGAMSLVQAKREAKAAAEKKVRAIMLSNFGLLASIPDRVALVAAVRSYVLTNGHVRTLDELRDAFNDAMDGLGYSLSENALKTTPEQAVADAWVKFESARSSLQDKHALLIGRLSLAQDRSQAADAA